jgi:limonene-1,2-epoxide hydrolase
MERAHVLEWIERYRAAWEEADADAAARLFAPKSSYRSLVFGAAHEGREGARAYWRRATRSQSEVSVSVGSPIVDADRVAVEWWATMADSEDGEITLPGVLLLSFRSGNLCHTLHEYWAVESGRREAFDRWGDTGPGDSEATRAAARQWAEGWERSWRSHEPGHALSRYSSRAVFRSQPFRAPAHGRGGVRAYMEWAFASEREPRPAFGRPRVDGDSAAVEYWATILGSEPDRAPRPTTIAGCALLRFDDSGLVVFQRDYWHTQEGHLRPPPEWGG